MLTSRITLGFLTLLATLLATACNNTPTTSTEEVAPPSAETVQPETLSSAAPTETSDSVVETSQIRDTRTGNFVSAEHETLGNVELIRTEEQQTLIFDENFATADGPDLVVVLHRSANVIEESTPPAYPLNEEDYVIVAPLADIAGRQEYAVPMEIDLEAFESVAVWCQAFNATFGVATLQ
jgi:hypothetical protein